ncbi:hypothetical protein AVL50_19120 [Flammeovirga sp. SJP92]|nr:hypothetical protein AVL50_19120 [Flammeovirga sp. SJP92]
MDKHKGVCPSKFNGYEPYGIYPLVKKYSQLPFKNKFAIILLKDDLNLQVYVLQNKKRLFQKIGSMLQKNIFQNKFLSKYNLRLN